jgi:NAD(P)-dependent dehydrogenase (short-subunit alcohol dehydrogenase family)
MTDSQKYSNKLASKRVLIIGGSSGIGYSVAEALLESRATVIISSSNPSRVSSSISSLLKSYPSAKERLSGHACDLSDPDTLEPNIVSLFEKCSSPDHVIFTAGDKLAHTGLQDADFAFIQKAGMVRFFAPLLVAKHAARVLPKSPSSSLTLTTGSVSEHPIPNWTVVGSYASGLHAMTRGLALDMKPVRVNLVSPGAVETPLWGDMDKEAFEKMKKSFEARTTTGVFAQPEDVAEAYIYLLKDQNVTGSMISTNGGGLLL